MFEDVTHVIVVVVVAAATVDAVNCGKTDRERRL